MTLVLLPNGVIGATYMGMSRESLLMACRDEELKKAHSAFQSNFDKEKRREAERKAELDRQRRVEVPVSPCAAHLLCALSLMVSCQECFSGPCSLK